MSIRLATIKDLKSVQELNLKLFEEDGKILGYLAGGLMKKDSARTIENMAELENMYVHPDCRSKGIVSQLTEKFFEWSKSKGATHVKVSANFQNIRGIKFYKKMGFEEFCVDLEKKL